MDRVLRDETTWIVRYLALEENSEIADVGEFREQKDHLMENLADDWLPEVFVFASKHILERVYESDISRRGCPTTSIP